MSDQATTPSGGNPAQAQPAGAQAPAQATATQAPASVDLSGLQAQMAKMEAELTAARGETNALRQARQSDQVRMALPDLHPDFAELGSVKAITQFDAMGNLTQESKAKLTALRESHKHLFPGSGQAAAAGGTVTQVQAQQGPGAPVPGGSVTAMTKDEVYAGLKDPAKANDPVWRAQAAQAWKQLKTTGAI
jgi:hypothetical protein